MLNCIDICWFACWITFSTLIHWMRTQIHSSLLICWPACCSTCSTFICMLHQPQRCNRHKDSLDQIECSLLTQLLYTGHGNLYCLCCTRLASSTARVTIIQTVSQEFKTGKRLCFSKVNRALDTHPNSRIIVFQLRLCKARAGQSPSCQSKFCWAVLYRLPAMQICACTMVCRLLRQSQLYCCCCDYFW